MDLRDGLRVASGARCEDRAHEYAARRQGDADCDEVELARLRRSEDRERAFVGIEEADHEGRLLGSLTRSAPGR